MKMFLITILLILGFTTAMSQDSLVCFTKSEAVVLANKIRLLQDSSAYKTSVIDVQQHQINTYITRVSLFRQQLDNRDSTIAIYKEQTDAMAKTIIDLQPKWYDNKVMWAGAGAVVTLVFVALVQ